MEKNNHPLIINFKNNIDSNGSLVSIEELKITPFQIKRIFYIYDTSNNAIRGNHANKNSEFLLICLVGSCKIKYFYHSTYHEVTLDKATTGLYLPKMIWKEMYEFSKDAILLAITNTHYDKDEYIKDFGIYLNEYKEHYEKNKF
jgi:dTDP-4-dehydrorhamnose 3,5-epimerase-like enzyme